MGPVINVSSPPRLSRDLIGDVVFDSLLRHWAVNYRCEAVTVDYLLDCGLDGQAEGARWAASCPAARLVFADDPPGFDGLPATAGPFPNHVRLLSGPAVWYWNWTGFSFDPFSRADCLPDNGLTTLVDLHSPLRSSHYRPFPSLPLAFCGLLDGYADWLAAGGRNFADDYR